MQKLCLFYARTSKSGFRERLWVGFDGLDSSGCMDKQILTSNQTRLRTQIQHNVLSN